ncbi:MAG TPA: DUF6273 domain-containing protein, partial [Paenibacillus sp.]|nr:DUF6273 domain-containing protein [Paenibacillus sp.]
MPRVRSFLVWSFLCLLLSAILFQPPFVGLADNSDFARAVQPLGLIAGEHPRYFHAFREFRLTEAAEGGMLRLLLPDVENELGYVSSQLLLAKAALLLNDAVRRAARADASVFDIRALGALYIALYGVGLTLFMTKLGARRAFARSVACAATILVFCDIGYVLYFHSFYGEAMILASLLLTAGSVLWCVSGETTPKRALLLFYASSFLFVSAKVANAPIGLLLAAFGGLLLPLRKDNAYRLIGIVGSASLLLFSILFYASTPSWMKQVNQYQAIFFGVLKDSPSPEEDLRALGLDPKYAALSGTHGYMPEAPYDIYGETFRKEVYERATYGDILAFYAKHPGRLLDKLRVSADASVFLRPSYLGNFEPDAGRERLSFAERFSAWERLRKRAIGHAFPIVLAVFAGYGAAILHACCKRFGREGRRRRDARSDAALGAGMLLAATATVQFVVPVLGNGEADLQKHMFLFVLCFDLMLVVGAVRLADRVRAKHAAIAAAALLLIPVAHWAQGIQAVQGIQAAPATAAAGLRIGDTVSLGKYDDKPLLWTVIAKEDEGDLLWLRDAVAARPFDALDEALPAASPDAGYGSNDWAASDVRRWLNRDFLQGFAEEERRLLRAVPLNTLVSAVRPLRERSGDQPHYWSPLPRDAEQNYDRAYGRRSTELVFLLDAQQLDRFVASR